MQAPEDVSTLANLTFSFLDDKNQYMKAFCVSPPDDSCPFSIPCPNNDVTGIGQQISIYITTIIYAVVLAYIPWLKRPMLYAHLSVIYSLLIAAVISMVKGELSKADGIFVVVSVASPASLYLWYYTVKSVFWGAHHFPIEHSNKNKGAHQSIEVKATQAVAALSFVFTVVMICLVFVPNIKGIKFPQKACDDAFNASALWYNVAWQLPVVIQSLSMIILYFMAYGLCLLWTRRTAYKTPQPLFESPKEFELPEFDDKPNLDAPSSVLAKRQHHIDIVSWTEKILNDQYPALMNRTLFICIVTNLQLSALPTFSYAIQSKDCFAILLLSYGLFHKRAGSVKVWLARVGIWIFFAGIWIVRAPILVGLDALPSSAAFLFLFVSCSAAKWSWNNFSGGTKRFLTVFNIVFGLIIVVANIWIVAIGDPKSFNTSTFSPDRAEYSFFTLNLLTLVLWIISWLSTSAWPWGKTLTWDKLHQGLWKRGHLMKMCWIVVGPHILWVQASNNTNLSRPMEMTFGQIFAVIVSAVTVVTLLDEAKDVEKPIWLAIIKSDPMYYEEVEQPKHYAVRPGLGMS